MSLFSCTAKLNSTSVCCLATSGGLHPLRCVWDEKEQLRGPLKCRAHFQTENGQMKRSFLFLYNKHFQTEHCFHGDHNGMPSWLLGEEEEGGGCCSIGNDECAQAGLRSVLVPQCVGGCGFINTCCSFHTEVYKSTPTNSQAFTSSRVEAGQNRTNPDSFMMISCGLGFRIETVMWTGGADQLRNGLNRSSYGCTNNRNASLPFRSRDLISVQKQPVDPQKALMSLEYNCWCQNVNICESLFQNVHRGSPFLLFVGL